MNVKRVGNKVQATLDPGEALRLPAMNVNVPEEPMGYPRVSNAIMGGVWRLIVAHAMKELDGLKIGWGGVDFLNGQFVVTFGSLDEFPGAAALPEMKK